MAAQSPSSGAEVPPNSPVNLVISSGDCVSVPSVVGDTLLEANQAITAAGLAPMSGTDSNCSGGSAPMDTVDSQTPAANAQVAPGSTVSFSVCVADTTSTTTTTSAGGGGTTTTSTSAPQGGGLFGG